MSSLSSQPSAPVNQPPPAAYTVVTRGVTFTLSRSQIEFDSPNYFTSAFLGDFAEAETKTIYLDREPKLLALIVDHLSGYRVLPLAEQSIPGTMTKETALGNLKTDAEYFGLDQLGALIHERRSVAAPAPPTPPTLPQRQGDMREYLEFLGLQNFDSMLRTLWNGGLREIRNIRPYSHLLSVEQFLQTGVSHIGALHIMQYQNEETWRKWDQGAKSVID